MSGSGACEDMVEGKVFFVAMLAVGEGGGGKVRLEVGMGQSGVSNSKASQYCG